MRFTLISATSKLNAECHIRRSLSCPLLSRILIMPCINLSFCKVECWTLKVSYVDPTHVQRSIGCFDEQRLWRVSWKSVIEPSSYFSSALDLFWSKLTCFHRLCKGTYVEKEGLSSVSEVQTHLFLLPLQRVLWGKAGSVSEVQTHLFSLPLLMDLSKKGLRFMSEVQTNLLFHSVQMDSQRNRNLKIRVCGPCSFASTAFANARLWCMP